jgi:hypothetical protein
MTQLGKIPMTFYYYSKAAVKAKARFERVKRPNRRVPRALSSLRLLWSIAGTSSWSIYRVLARLGTSAQEMEHRLMPGDRWPRYSV